MGWNELSDPDMRTANFEFSCDVYREGVYGALRFDRTADASRTNIGYSFLQLVNSFLRHINLWQLSMFHSFVP